MCCYEFFCKSIFECLPLLCPSFTKVSKSLTRISVRCSVRSFLSILQQVLDHRDLDYCDTCNTAIDRKIQNKRLMGFLNPFTTIFQIVIIKDFEFLFLLMGTFSALTHSNHFGLFVKWAK